MRWDRDGTVVAVRRGFGFRECPRDPKGHVGSGVSQDEGPSAIPGDVRFSIWYKAAGGLWEPGRDGCTPHGHCVSSEPQDASLHGQHRSDLLV